MVRLGNRTDRGYVNRIQNIKNFIFLIPSTRFIYTRNPINKLRYFTGMVYRKAEFFLTCPQNVASFPFGSTGAGFTGSAPS